MKRTARHIRVISTIAAVPSHQPRPSDRRVDDPQVNVAADLLTPSGGWNVELIKQTFIPVGVQAILCTPVRGMGDDSWAWEPERHGLYSVRSAYKRLCEDQYRVMDENQASYVVK